MNSKAPLERVQPETKNMKYLSLFLLSAMLFFASCSKGPKPIDFGHENCHHCKMLIADPKFGAEAVSKTGKTIKYDAAECLILDLKGGGIDEEKMADYYVIAFDKPRKLIDAAEATFLISPNVPSPMGAYLSAFSSRESAEAMKKEKGGELYSWEQVRKKIAEN